MLIFLKHFFAFILPLFAIGGHLLRYPWSATSDWAWYWNFRYQTEDSGVRHYIRYWNKLLSDIRHPHNYRPAQWLRGKVLAYENKVLGSNPGVVKNIFWISDIGMDSDVNIGTLPISEWQFLVRHIFFQYRNNRCRCRISPTLRPMSMPTHALCINFILLISFHLLSFLFFCIFYLLLNPLFRIFPTNDSGGGGGG